MNIKKNGQVIRLTESDLKRIVKRILTEQEDTYTPPSFWDEFTRGAKYIWNDIKDAASETSEIPSSFAKLGDFLTSKKNWQEVGRGFETMGNEIVDAAEEVGDWFTGLFNEQRLHEQKVGSDGQGPLDKLISKIKNPKSKAKAGRFLRQMQKLIQLLKDKTRKGMRKVKRHMRKMGS
tara:strand:+ start:4072 stop:4602 length:531 start_codon:yes stop_codon:yes gene_type:complete